MLSKKFIAGIFLIFIALLFVITILTSSINPFEANVLGHIIDLDYLEAGALLFGVTGLTFVLRDISERE